MWVRADRFPGKGGPLSRPWRMGKVPWAPPPVGALLMSSQGDSSVLKLKAKLNQQHKPTTGTEATLSSQRQWWQGGDECAELVTHLALSPGSFEGVATSESPIPTSRVRLTTQAAQQDISSSVAPPVRAKWPPLPR